jgi:hypothetical protein
MRVVACIGNTCPLYEGHHPETVDLSLYARLCSCSNHRPTEGTDVVRMNELWCYEKLQNKEVDGQVHVVFRAAQALT